MIYHGNLRRIEGGRRGFYDRQAPPPPITLFWWFVGQMVIYATGAAVAVAVSLAVMRLGL